MRDPRDAATLPPASHPFTSAVWALSSPAPTVPPPVPAAPAQHAVARWAALAAQQQCRAAIPHQTVRSA